MPADRPAREDGRRVRREASAPVLRAGAAAQGVDDRDRRVDVGVEVGAVQEAPAHDVDVHADVAIGGEDEDDSDYLSDDEEIDDGDGFDEDDEDGDVNLIDEIRQGSRKIKKQRAEAGFPSRLVPVTKKAVATAKRLCDLLDLNVQALDIDRTDLDVQVIGQDTQKAWERSELRINVRYLAMKHPLTAALQAILDAGTNDLADTRQWATVPVPLRLPPRDQNQAEEELARRAHGIAPQISWRTPNVIVADWPGLFSIEQNNITAYWVRDEFRDAFGQQLAAVLAKWTGLTHRTIIDGQVVDRIAVPSRFMALAWKAAFCRLDQRGLVTQVPQNASSIKVEISPPRGRRPELNFGFGTLDCQITLHPTCPIVGDIDIPDELRAMTENYPHVETMVGRLNLAEIEAHLPAAEYSITRKRLQILGTIAFQYRYDVVLVRRKMYEARLALGLVAIHNERLLFKFRSYKLKGKYGGKAERDPRVLVINLGYKAYDIDVGSSRIAYYGFRLPDIADVELRRKLELEICRRATARYENTGGNFLEALSLIVAHLGTLEEIDLSTADVRTAMLCGGDLQAEDCCAHPQGSRFYHACHGCTNLVTCDELERDGEDDGALFSPLLCRPCASTSTDALARAHLEDDAIEDPAEWHLFSLLKPLVTRDIRDYERTDSSDRCIDAREILADLAPRIILDRAIPCYVDEVFGCEVPWQPESSSNRLDLAFAPSIDALYGVVVQSVKSSGVRVPVRGIHIRSNLVVTSEIFNRLKNDYSLTTTLPWLQAMCLNEEGAVAFARCRNAADLLDVNVRRIMQTRRVGAELEKQQELSARLARSAARDSHIPWRRVDRLEPQVLRDEVIVKVMSEVIDDAGRYYNDHCKDLASRPWSTGGRTKPEVDIDDVDVSHLRYPLTAPSIELDVKDRWADGDLQFLKDFRDVYNPEYEIPLTRDGHPYPFAPSERDYWSRAKLLKAGKEYAASLWSLGDREFVEQGQHDPALPPQDPDLAGRNLVLLGNMLAIVLNGADATTGLPFTSDFRSSASPTKLVFGAFISGVPERTGFTRPEPVSIIDDWNPRLCTICPQAQGVNWMWGDLSPDERAVAIPRLCLMTRNQYPYR